MRLILVRHGETAWNEAGRYQGWEDPPLSPKGRRTARRLAHTLRCHGVQRCTLWASDLRRAVATARIAVGRMPRIDARLRELDFGTFGGRTYEENVARFGSRFLTWVEHEGRPAPPGGEDLDDFLERTRAWLGDVRRSTPRGETVVAVTHGGVVRTLVRPFAGETFWPGNGEVTVLRWTEDGAPPDIDRWIREEEEP